MVDSPVVSLGEMQFCLPLLLADHELATDCIFSNETTVAKFGIGNRPRDSPPSGKSIVWSSAGH
jgi:hypothetical protein